MPSVPPLADAPRAALVHRLAADLGFALVSIAPAKPADHGPFLRQWLEEGRQGQMDYMLEELEQRLDPALLVPGAQSIICVADRHATEEPAEPTPALDQPRGRIARYAWGHDYHRVMKKRLHDLADALRVRWPQHVYRSAVDTAPVMERQHAQRAGLGWIGKHTLLLHPALGSFLMLGQIITTLPLQSAGSMGPGVSDHCGGCTRCLDACPTQCLTPYRIDARRCISYLTLEHRGPIDPSLHQAMGDWIAGCDICQEVCPYNQQPAREPPLHPSYQPRPPAPALPLLEALGWDGPARQRAFERSALKRLKLDQLKRNALIAAGNALAHTPNPALRQRLEELAGDENQAELVRATARQVLARLQGLTDATTRGLPPDAPVG